MILTRTPAEAVGSRKKDTCAHLGGRNVVSTDFCTDFEAGDA